MRFTVRFSLAAFAVATGALTLTAAPTARADGTSPDELRVPAPAGPEIAPRSWVYLDDPTTPSPWHVTAYSRMTATGYGGSATRPFGTDIAHPGSVLEVGGELGLTPWLSIAASGYTSTLAPSSTPGSGDFGTMVGLRAAPFASVWKTTHLVFSGGYLRELGGGNGAWGRVSLAQDVGRARFGTTVHGEHVFANGRDGVDVMVMAGASYRVVGPLRGGVEYVAQDLEEIAGDAAEAGMRHFVGPTASVELLDKRLTLNGGPAFGLSKGSPPVLGRFAIGYAF